MPQGRCTAEEVEVKPIIQVCGCVDIAGDVCSFVSDATATFYGVYLGITGAPYTWLGDFDKKEDALAYAQGEANARDGEVDDRTWGR